MARSVYDVLLARTIGLEARVRLLEADLAEAGAKPSPRPERTPAARPRPPGARIGGGGGGAALFQPDGGTVAMLIDDDDFVDDDFIDEPDELVVEPAEVPPTPTFDDIRSFVQREQMALPAP